MTDAKGYPIIDGVRLQHALGVAYKDGKVYIADTYNNKIKVADATTGAVRTVAGDGQPGKEDSPPRFRRACWSFDCQRAALHRRHQQPPDTLARPQRRRGTYARNPWPDSASPEAQASEFRVAERRQLEKVQLRAVDGQVTLKVRAPIPEGAKINELAPMSYWVTQSSGQAVAGDSLGRRKLDKPRRSSTSYSKPRGQERHDRVGHELFSTAKPKTDSARSGPLSGPYRWRSPTAAPHPRRSSSPVEPGSARRTSALTPQRARKAKISESLMALSRALVGNGVATQLPSVFFRLRIGFGTKAAAPAQHDGADHARDQPPSGAGSHNQRCGACPTQRWPYRLASDRQAKTTPHMAPTTTDNKVDRGKTASRQVSSGGDVTRFQTQRHIDIIRAAFRRQTAATQTAKAKAGQAK